MAEISPEDIKRFEKVRINGEINGEEYLEEDFCDLNEVWNLVNKPVYEVLNYSKIEGKSITKPTFGTYGSNEELSDYIQDQVDTWESNKDADIFFYFNDHSGNTYEFEAVLRSDKSVVDTEKPFSFIELRHDPSEHRTTADEEFDSVQRFALRNAFKYTDEYLGNTNVGSGHDFIYEADLIAAFDREGGLWDQFEKSKIPFSQLIRSGFSFIPVNQDIEFNGISDSAPYIASYVTNEVEDGGISEENAAQAGRHIGTANALGLSFRQDREREELKLDYDPRFGESLIIIDPEFAKHVDSNSRNEDFSEDFSVFRQQFLPPDNWRKIDSIMKNERDDLVNRAEDSSKEWSQVLPNQLPDNWESEIPDHRILDTEL